MSTKGTDVSESTCTLGFSFVRGRGLEQHGHAAGGVNKAPVGLCLVRGSWTRRNVYQGDWRSREYNVLSVFLLCEGEDSNSTAVPQAGQTKPQWGFV